MTDTLNTTHLDRPPDTVAASESTFDSSTHPFQSTTDVLKILANRDSKVDEKLGLSSLILEENKPTDIIARYSQQDVAAKLSDVYQSFAERFPPNWVNTERAFNSLPVNWYDPTSADYRNLRAECAKRFNESYGQQSIGIMNVRGQQFPMYPRAIIESNGNIKVKPIGIGPDGKWWSLPNTADRENGTSDVIYQKY